MPASSASWSTCPVVSYYEIGTALTANHAHAAMMGVYGMLAIGLALFCLRYLIPQERWPDRLAQISFWCCNIGLAWMCFATLLPLGILQLYKSVNDGYFAARQLEFITNPSNSLIEWMRLPGDVVFIVGGALPFLWICWLGVRYRVRNQVMEEPEDMLFTEIGDGRDGGRVGDAAVTVSPELLVLAGYCGLPARCRRRPGPAGAAQPCPVRPLPHRRVSATTRSTTRGSARRTRCCGPTRYDESHHLMRYRAKPSVCNACPVKADCTSSHARPGDQRADPAVAALGGGAVPPRDRPGPGRPRGAALAAVAMARHTEPAELAVARRAAGAAGVLGHRFTDHFRRYTGGLPRRHAGHRAARHADQPHRLGIGPEEAQR